MALSDADELYLKDVFSDCHALSEELRLAAASEVFQHRAQGRTAQQLKPFVSQILTRAWSRVRAQGNPRDGVDGRAKMRAAQVQEVARDIPYLNFFALEDSHYTHEKFDGSPSGTMQRAVFLMADAVTVLPYDPVRDRVLVIEQMRFGPFARGDQAPWVIEPIAGRIDVGEEAEQTARREAVEEAGLTLGALHQVAEYYVSPGAATEYLTSFVAIADLPDDVVGTGGLEVEQEDIRSHLLSHDAFMQMCDAGQLDTGPLFISALWLARHRDRLRG